MKKRSGTTTLSGVKILIAIFALSGSGLLLATEYEAASTLLERMSKSLRESNYQGRFVYITDEVTNSFSLQHALIKEKEYERLVFLNKDKQEIVRIGHDLFCIHTGNYLLSHQDEISSNPFSDRVQPLKQGVEKYYQLKVKEGERIAGREAVKVSFEARDGFRFNHALWIDGESYLLLKSEISDPMLGSLESFEYVQLEVDTDIPLSEFSHKGFIRHSPKHYHPQNGVASGQKQSQDSLWQISWLPDGFYFSGESAEKFENEKEIAMLMYSDGIAAISIFVEPVDKAGTFSESSQSGALSAFTRGVEFDKQYYMVTAVGEVPLATLERVSKALLKNHSENPAIKN